MKQKLKKEKTHLPPSSEVIQNGFKIQTEFRFNNDGKKEKIVRIYKREQRMILTSVIKRRLWKKFGDSIHDKNGPNPANTFLGEDVCLLK